MEWDINPLKDKGVKWLHFAIRDYCLTYIFYFWHSSTLALRAQSQSAWKSEIKNVG